MAVLLLGGKWFLAALQAAMLVYLLHSWHVKQHTVDATDVFRQLPAQKKVGGGGLGGGGGGGGGEGGGKR